MTPYNQGDVAHRLNAALADVQLAPYVSGSAEPWSVSTIIGLMFVARPKRVLELGTFMGLTTKALAGALTPEQTLTTVELDTARFVNAKRHVGERANVTHLQADALAFLRQCAPGDFDFAFVDDDHTYAHVAAEIVELKRILPKDSLIVMHDVVGDFGLGDLVRVHGGVIIDLPILHNDGALGVIRV